MTFGEKISASTGSGKAIEGLLKKMMMMMMKNNYDDPKNRKIAYHEQILACKSGGRYGKARVIYR